MPAVRSLCDAALAEQLRADAVPSTQRASSSSAAPPELVLYRDTNAWCPFCERVWLALEAKGVSYTCEFVDLRRVHVSLSFRFSPVARGQRSIASPFN